MPHDENATDASLGDAQSDALGGATVIMMVLFIALAVLLAIVLVVFQKTQAEAEQSAERAAVAEAAVATLTNGKITVADLKKIEEAVKLEDKVKELEAKLKKAEILQKKAEAEARAQTKKAAQAQIQLKKTQADLKKSKEPQTFVSAGMRLWVFPNGNAAITEPEPVNGRWVYRFSCEKDNRSSPARGNGGGTAVKDYTLIR